MPVDPNISLEAVGAGTGPANPGWTLGGGGGAPVNPLVMLAGITELRQKMAQSQLLQQQVAARQKLGQIIAGASDLATGIDLALKDQSVAGQIPDVLASVAGIQNAVQTYKGMVQGQTQDAYGHVVSGLMTGASNPALIGQVLQASLNNIPDKKIRENVSGSVSNLTKSLTNGMPFPLETDDPAEQEANKKKYLQNLVAIGIGTGSLDTLSRLAATPTTQELGNVKQPGTIGAPVPSMLSQPPGQFNASGNALVLGIAPQLGSSESVQFGAGGPSNALGLTAPQSARNAPSGTSTSSNPGKQTSAQLESTRIAGDGKPLFGKGWDSEAQTPIGRTIGGQPLWKAPALVNEAAQDFAEEHGPYKQSQNTLSSLAEMDNNFDYLGQHGGLVTPGSFGEDRTRVARFINTLSAIGGGNTVIDPKDVAAGEDIMKVTQRMGPQVLQSLLGQQREAAETIANMNEKGVPGINNSVLGGKLLISSIRQATQRLIDLHDFKTKWAGDHEGNMFGADKAFNEQHPATDYLNKAMEEYGLTKNGFASAQDVIAQAKKGYLTKEQAQHILEQSFPNGPEKK